MDDIYSAPPAPSINFTSAELNCRKIPIAEGARMSAVPRHAPEPARPRFVITFTPSPGVDAGLTIAHPTRRKATEHLKFREAHRYRSRRHPSEALDQMS
jgi:hypothetical protein